MRPQHLPPLPTHPHTHTHTHYPCVLHSRFASVNLWMSVSVCWECLSSPCFWASCQAQLPAVLGQGNTMALSVAHHPPSILYQLGEKSCSKRGQRSAQKRIQVQYIRAPMLWIEHISQNGNDALYKLKVRASGVYFPSIYDAEDTADKPDIEMVQWNVEMWLSLQWPQFHSQLMQVMRKFSTMSKGSLNMCLSRLNTACSNKV